MPRPWSIKQFEAIYLIWLIVTISLQAMAMMSAAEFAPEIPRTAMPYVYLAYALFGLRIAVNIVLWYYVARRANRIARIVYVVLVGVSIVWTLATASYPDVRLPTPPQLISILVQILSVWLLFRSDSKRWFAHGIQTDLEETFS